jgi:3-hydroxyisobutyrate dehydrogenase-like beta-hydroxyacid dehydrogenase
LIQGQADDIEVTLRLGGVARELFDEAADKGMAGEDMAAIFKLWSEGPAAT